MYERTTDLTRLKYGATFTWGRVIKIHEIGEYAIVEHSPREMNSNKYDESRTEYHSYVNGKDACCDSGSLDAAIAACIAHKYEGMGHRADYYFMKMLKGE